MSTPYCFNFFFFFKQKTAYELPLRLVGSERCIRGRFKREGSIAPYVKRLDELSQARVKVDPQFNYLEQRKDISKKTEDQKRVVLDIDQRKAELLALEKQTLDSENKRRQIAGQKPYANWESYQASMEALVEARAKMKANQRPALPEEEAFVTESANVLLDYAKLQKGTAK